jgi:hypothetical protein
MSVLEIDRSGAAGSTYRDPAGRRHIAFDVPGKCSYQLALYNIG